MRRGLVLVWACCAAGGCGAEIEGEPGATPNSEIDLIDAAVTTPDDATATCSNGRVVYLSFEGETLTQAAVSDATQNQASWLTKQTGKAPRYREDAANRDAEIQEIVDGVRQLLAGFPITVVTTRPIAGPYVMIVFGGNSNAIGSRYNGATNELDCGDTVKSDVAWISGGVGPNQRVVNYAVGAIGLGLGLTGTTDPEDCMCGWDNDCDQVEMAPCKLSRMIDRDPDAEQQCPGLTTQDELAVFDAAFCR